MEKLEIKSEDFELEANMRCAGRCKGSCSCPSGHCRCKTLETNEPSYDLPSQEYFL